MPENPELLLSELPEEVANILDTKIPKKDRQVVMRFVQNQINYNKTSLGLLPDANELMGYNQALPSGADRIIALTEQQQKHRIRMESLSILNQIIQTYIGQLFGISIGLAGLYVTYKLALINQPELAAIIGSLDIIGLVSIFVLGKKYQQDNG